jgi:hypothetical protein
VRFPRAGTTVRSMGGSDARWGGEHAVRGGGRGGDRAAGMAGGGTPGGVSRVGRAGGDDGFNDNLGGGGRAATRREQRRGL